jgi:hypothetical protein
MYTVQLGGVKEVVRIGRKRNLLEVCHKTCRTAYSDLQSRSINTGPVDNIYLIYTTHTYLLPFTHTMPAVPAESASLPADDLLQNLLDNVRDSHHEYLARLVRLDALFDRLETVRLPLDPAIQYSNIHNLQAPTDLHSTQSNSQSALKQPAPPAAHPRCSPIRLSLGYDWVLFSQDISFTRTRTSLLIWSLCLVGDRLSIP